jgi:DNA-binding response OmpR family regulator
MHKVLIVDDDLHVRNIFSSQFKNSFETYVASDGEGAIRAAKEVKPKLIFLDVSMPGHIDGFDVLKEIKATPSLKNSIVAMVTANRNPLKTQKARDFGADAYFIKPFSPLMVHKWVREQLREQLNSQKFDQV